MRTTAFAFLMAGLMLGAGRAWPQVNCGPQNDQCTITKYGLGTKPDFRFDKVPFEAYLFDLDHGDFGDDQTGISYSYLRSNPNTLDAFSCGPETSFFPLRGQFILKEEPCAEPNPTSTGPRCVGGANNGRDCHPGYDGVNPVPLVLECPGGICEVAPGTSCRVEIPLSNAGLTPPADTTEGGVFTAATGTIAGQRWQLTSHGGVNWGGTSDDSNPACLDTNVRRRPTMGTRYRLPASRGGDGIKTYVRWDSGFGLVDPAGCDPDNPAAPNYCARMNLATTFHTHTDDSAVCCTSPNPSHCDIVVRGQPNYPLLLSRTCADPGRVTGVDDNVTSDWIFTGGKGTRFFTDPDHQLAGQMAGVCTVNRLQACFRPEATQLCTGSGVPYSCCTGNLTGTCGTECVAPDTCDLRERGYRGQVRCGRFQTQTSNNGNPDPRCCATSVTVLRGEPGRACTLLPRYPVNGDPGPGCQLQNYGIDRRDDADCDGVADVPVDTCPFLSEWDQDLDSDGDCPGAGCRGDECECADQSSDGRVSVTDIVEINLAIFGATDQKLICDGNNDNACNVSDIVAANREIFVPDSSTCRHITSSRCNDGIVDAGEICDDGPRVCHGVCTGGSNPGTPCDGNSGSGATTPCLGGGVCSVPPNKGAPCSGSDITPCGGPATCFGQKTCRDGAFAGQLCTTAGECGTTVIGGQPRPSSFCDPATALGGDGCNAACRQEFGWTCIHPPGGASTCTPDP